MIELNGQPAEVAFTITIKRKETGLEETYNMVGVITEEEPQDGSHTHDSGA
jgi:hypothetical protein